MNAKKNAKIKIAPSILAADFGRLNDEIKSIEPFVDLIHVDVMDGHFVPNITIGIPIVASLKSKHPLDCHLMIENPERYIDAFAEAIKKSQGKNAKKSNITVHIETCKKPENLLRQIKKNGVRAGISLNPETPLSSIIRILNDVDLVLVMSVAPGFGGQEFMKEILPKIEKLRRLRPKLDIEIDGGINEKTAPLAVAAGANILVAGSYLFKAKNRRKAAGKLR